MKLLNFKHMVRVFYLLLGFVLQLVLLTNPTITKAEVSSVTLLSLCSELQINMGILAPTLSDLSHVHAAYHEPPVLDDIKKYLDYLERGTPSASLTEEIKLGKTHYEKYRGLPGLAVDKARTSLSEQLKFLLTPNDEKVIELYCNVTSKLKTCSISEVSEINLNCAKALIEVHFEQCMKKTELTSDMTIPCAASGIFSERAAHHRNGKILESAYKAWRPGKTNWNEKLDQLRRKRNDLKP